jgi:hypothetical protein
VLDFLIGCQCSMPLRTNVLLTLVSKAALRANVLRIHNPQR